MREAVLDEAVREVCQWQCLTPKEVKSLIFTSWPWRRSLLGEYLLTSLRQRFAAKMAATQHWPGLGGK